MGSDIEHELASLIERVKSQRNVEDAVQLIEALDGDTTPAPMAGRALEALLVAGFNEDVLRIGLVRPQPDPRIKKVAARAAYNLGKTDKSLQLLESVAEADRDYGFHILLARVKLASGQKTDAILSFETASQCSPNRFEPHWEIANIHFRSGDLARSLHSLRTCLEKSADNVRVLRRFANLSLLLGNAKDAARAMEKVAEFSGDISDRANLMRAYLAADQSIRAKSIWADLMQQRPAGWSTDVLPSTLVTTALPVNAMASDLQISDDLRRELSVEQNFAPLFANGGLTVILTSFRRPEYLLPQLFAVANQSVRPDFIWHWANNGGVEQPNIPGLPAAKCSVNFRYHGRFALALLARTRFVAIFDDDTVPGPFWFENCLREHSVRPAIYGAIGVTAEKPDEYVPNKRTGWAGTNNNSTAEVDLVGHAWFFERQLLSHLWAEEPLSWQTGEDIHFSYAAQVLGGTPTCVPPHPISDKAIWGSLLGEDLGADHEAASYQLKGQHNELRSECMRQALQRGWKPLSGR